MKTNLVFALLMVGQIAIGKVKVDKISTNVRHNVYLNGIKGMQISPKFNIENGQWKSIRVSAYFYKNDGSALTDYNGQFTTTDGNVAVSTTIKIDNEYEVYQVGTTLFIPYNELHLSENASYDLKFFVSASCDGVPLSQSNWYPFTYTSGSYTKLYFENKTGRKLYILVHTLDGDNKGTTKGWYAVGPYEKAYVTNSFNSAFYYYVKDVDKTATWEGKDFRTTFEGEPVNFIKDYTYGNGYIDGVKTVKLEFK